MKVIVNIPAEAWRNVLTHGVPEDNVAILWRRNGNAKQVHTKSTHGNVHFSRTWHSHLRGQDISYCYINMEGR